jgi:hypothetical protein
MDDLNTPQTAPLPRQQERRPAWRRFRPGARLAAGLTAIAVLVCGSVLAITLASGGGSQAGAALAANTAGSAAAAGGNAASRNAHGAAAAANSGGSPTGMAWPGPGSHRVGARLRACFTTARRLRASGHRTAARASLRACIQRFVRLRAGLAILRLHRLRILIHRTLHGQITIETKNGSKTLAFERGAVQSVAANSLVVRAADGTTWTWVLSSATRVIKACQRVGLSTLAVGQRVVVLGEVSGGSDQARRVLILG